MKTNLTSLIFPSTNNEKIVEPKKNSPQTQHATRQITDTNMRKPSGNNLSNERAYLNLQESFKSLNPLLSNSRCAKHDYKNDIQYQSLKFDNPKPEKVLDNKVWQYLEIFMPKDNQFDDEGDALTVSLVAIHTDTNSKNFYQTSKVFIELDLLKYINAYLETSNSSLK